MELLDKIKAQAGKISKVFGRYERGANYELGQSLSSNAVSSIFGTGGENIDVAVEYSGYAWKAIDIRANMLSAQDLFVERKVGDKWIADGGHPFNEVLEGGESQLDLSDLLEAHSKSMDLYGESFWYFSKGENYGKPMGIYLLDPNAMTVYIANNKVTGYLYQKDGERVALELDEIQHYKIHDWRHPFRGTGPMQSAGWFIKSARYVTTYSNNFLENNAIPAGVIVAKGDVDDADWKLFKSEWISKYGGIDNIGKTGFVRGSDLSFVKTGLSLGEIDFDKVKNSSRDDIMIMFGISKPMFAIFDDINRASATVAQQLFAKGITEPALKRLARKNSKAVVGWYGAQYRIGHSNPIPEDEDAKLQLYKEGVGKFLTVNEARAAYGLEPMDGGNALGTESELKTAQALKVKADAAGTLIRAGFSATPSLAASGLADIPHTGFLPVTVKTDGLVPEDADNLVEPDKKSTPEPKSFGKITIRTKSTELNYEMKESFRSETQEVQEKYEAKFFQAGNKVLKEQKERVLQQIVPTKLVDSKFDIALETETITAATLPLMRDLAKEQGELAAKFAGGVDSAFEFNSVSETYVLKSLKKALTGFNEETQELLAKTIAEGVQEGESISKISKRIDKVYSDMLGVKEPGYRLERLARTEVIKTSNQMTVVAYKQSGVVTKKEWITNPGACEFCKALDGSVIQLDSSFVALGDSIEGVDGGTHANTYEAVKHPPTHPSCRCGLAPVLEGKS